MYEERRRAREAEREAKELAEEEEAAHKEEARLKAQDEEAAKWMGQIDLQQQGEEAQTEEQTQASNSHTASQSLHHAKALPAQLGCLYRLRSSQHMKDSRAGRRMTDTPWPGNRMSQPQACFCLHDMQICTGHACYSYSLSTMALWCLLQARIMGLRLTWCRGTFR